MGSPPEVTMSSEQCQWPRPADDPDLGRSFEILRRKWGEVPAGSVRVQSSSLGALSDSELGHYWERIHEEALEHRLWFETLYSDVFRGKRVLDVGCGLAISTLYFAMNGAKVTFLDIIEENVRVAERLARIKQVRDAGFCFMRNLNSLEPLGLYDVIFCCGSLINAPLELVQLEAQALLKHLGPKGRWIEFAYPKERWLRDGSMPFAEWGRMTDGGAPWMEWHDLEKVLWYLSPTEFDVILELPFHGQDFNWFDLRRK